MADPSAAPAGGAASSQDVLLATKLHVPCPPPGFVPRRRLVEALDEGVARGRVAGRTGVGRHLADAGLLNNYTCNNIGSR